VRSPLPKVGQHTDEVMRAYGFDAAEIASLREAGVLAGT
jgi:crotonobetainyl-CoA:carnitine CoA-transferase CaiB-like acyl-CoA transferase